MLAALRAAVAAVEDLARDFEAGLLGGDDAAVAVKVAARGEHALAAVKALAAVRVKETGAFHRSGAKDASQWLARSTGVTVGAADKALRTAERLPELPATSEAFRKGHLSEAQAFEVSGAAQVNPAREQELLGHAQDRSFKGLKDEARRARAEAEEDDAAWAQRLDDARSLSMWTESGGLTCGIWKGPPDKGAEIKAAIDAETDRIFREANREGRREEREAYAFDALHSLVTRGPRRRTGATVVIDAERCEIPGIGPIPATIAKRMLEGANVRVVDADPMVTTDVDKADSRYLPADLRARLRARYPVCSVPGCDQAYGQEFDHVVPVCEGGRTVWENLWLPCRDHHRKKTYDGWIVVGDVHAWDLVPPGDSRAGPDDPDPP